MSGALGFVCLFVVFLLKLRGGAGRKEVMVSQPESVKDVGKESEYHSS